jgi:hypothetical protein
MGNMTEYAVQAIYERPIMIVQPGNRFALRICISKLDGRPSKGIQRLSALECSVSDNEELFGQSGG